LSHAVLAVLRGNDKLSLCSAVCKPVDKPPLINRNHIDTVIFDMDETLPDLNCDDRFRLRHVSEIYAEINPFRPQSVKDSLTLSAPGDFFSSTDSLRGLVEFWRKLQKPFPFSSDSRVFIDHKPDILKAARDYDLPYFPCICQPDLSGKHRGGTNSPP